MVGIVAGVTVCTEFLGGLLAIHNVIRYLYMQKRYVGNGLSLVVFYSLAILVFSFRIAQIFLIVDPRS